MIEIRTIEDVREKLNLDEIDISLLMDLVKMTIVFETEFSNSEINKIVILDKDEDYDEPHPYPEIEETIGLYNKKVFIVCDSGEGITIYRKVGEMGA